MKKIIIVLFTFSIFFTPFFNHDISAETSKNISAEKENKKNEKYVRKELFTLKWGQGENELGGRINCRDLGNSSGPHQIKVNSDGDIFIYDYENGRFLVISKDGKNITKKYNQDILHLSKCHVDFVFDKDNNIYLLTDNKYIEVFSYREKFKRREEIEFSDSLSSSFSNKYIRIDNQGDIYVINRGVNKLKKIDKNNFIETKSVKGIKYSRYKSIIESKSIRFIHPDYYTEKIIYITTPKSFKERTLKLNYKEKYRSVYNLVNEDKYGYVYILICVYDKIEPGSGKYFVQKFNIEGNFITNINIDQDEMLYSYIENEGAIIYVDEEGNLYHLNVKQEGVKLIKWELVK